MKEHYDATRVWAEKIGKKWKNSKNLKVAGNYLTCTVKSRVLTHVTN